MKYCNDALNHEGQRRLATYISYWPNMSNIYSCPECYKEFEHDIGQKFMTSEVYKLVPLFPFNDPIICQR